MYGASIGDPHLPCLAVQAMYMPLGWLRMYYRRRFGSRGSGRVCLIVKVWLNISYSARHSPIVQAKDVGGNRAP